VTRYLVPEPSNGSVEHFYHFVVEYLLPLYELKLTSGFSDDMVLKDCGPLNPWLDHVFGAGTFSFRGRDQFADEVSRASVDQVRQLEAFAGKDNVLVDGTRFAEVAAALRAGVAPAPPPRSGCTLIDRREPPEWYLDGRAEKPGGGSTRRSISNLPELERALAGLTEVTTVEFVDLSPAEQIERVSGSKVLIGQHGAGLTHAVFLASDAAVIELNSEPEDWTYFRVLCNGLGIEYRSVRLDSLHATLSAETIDDVVSLASHLV
jgi:hypothetical protein